MQRLKVQSAAHIRFHIRARRHNGVFVPLRSPTVARRSEGGHKNSCNTARLGLLKQRNAQTQCFARQSPLSGRRRRNLSANSESADQTAAGLAEQTSELVQNLAGSRDFDPEILAIALPALGSILLDSLMLLVDTAIVGRLGTAPLGAVGLSTLLFVFSNLFFNFLLVVTTSKVASAAANDNAHEVSTTTAVAMFIAISCGALLCGLLWFNSPVLLQLLGADPEVAVLSVNYLRVRCFAAPAFLMYLVATGNFRGRKDTRTPFFASLALNVVWAGLELLFVFGLGWGVVGAALAPALGQYAGLAAMMVLLFREKALEPAHLAQVPTWEAVMPFLKAAASLGLVNLLVMPVIIGCTNLVNVLGVVVLAAHTIIRQIWDFWMQLCQCWNVSAQTMVAGALGKDDTDAAREVLARVLMLGVLPGAVLAIVFLVGQGRIPAAFTSDVAVVQAVQNVIPLMAICMPLIPVATVLEGALLGALDTGWVAKRTVPSLVLGLGTILASQFYFHVGLIGIWLGMSLFYLSNVALDTFRLTSVNSPLARSILQPKVE